MKRIEISKPCKKSIHKLFHKNPKLKPIFRKTFAKLLEDPFTPSLKTHKLKGRLKNFWSCSVTFEIRLVFQIEPEAIILIDIGFHDEVY